MEGVTEIVSTKAEAKMKYKEYRAAAQQQSVPYLRELRDAYNQLRRGHGIIDIFKAFKMAGVNDDGEPRLAIYPAHLPKCFLRKEESGAASMRVEYRRRWDSRAEIQFPINTFPAWKTEKNGNWNYIVRKDIFCPVPTVPPLLMPKADLSNFFILWEPSEWKIEPPKPDPFLLRRVSNNLFAVVAKWDLTELECAVIAGRIR